jgi:hypothetical protein
MDIQRCFYETLVQIKEDSRFKGEYELIEKDDLMGYRISRINSNTCQILWEHIYCVKNLDLLLE